MLRIVENEPAIRRYRRQFVRSLKPLVDEKIPVKLGHPGANMKATVAWSEKLGIWFFSRKIAGGRYWHAFGVGRPEGGAGVAITCEINFPLCGIDRRTGGAFAQDREGGIYVVHRGKLGGGRKGVGKSLFENRYRGVWEIIDDGGEETAVAVIGVLGSPRFARQIAQFVRKIARIKEAAVIRSPQAELGFDESTMREELIGDRYCELERRAGAECDRGLVIRDLCDALKRKGLRARNDGERDLMAVNREGRILAVFHVRTETFLTGLRDGAAQLMLSVLDVPDRPMKVLVLPRTPDNLLQDKLKEMNISLLTFAWEGDRAVFPGLNDLLSRIA
jgi:hypothetical protein